ncbi:carboxylesterase family protein [Planotetraspora phitsanulokensis]|uniref:Carboxylic ester hydrolase n=1 Tax=Planotetraspora phitsanulokensis TaxID=575192 RepID=A0A8J3U1V2_9ACTN|nr:carboxylesterase family protein [Planotetraspora phitsanulokensis]GII36700.1 carboxylic ester hydrolase [Planotetraspora phitsanulokensis]
MDAVVRTSAGRVRGASRDGVVVFRGVPFAAAPEGPLRFRAPVRAKSWDDVRDALEFGSAPPQSPPLAGMPEIWRPRDGLDCLTVNVWTPGPGAADLPVMVWIYGGAWQSGSASQPGYDGARLARAGVVVVTFNYRVGFEGFGRLPGTPANRGLLDQIAALEWVQAEIAAFGGDPGNVTVFGESAGAGSVAVLAAAPAARGLFRRAIAQSVPAGSLAEEEAEQVTALIAAEAGAEPTWEGFAGLAPEAILRVQDVRLPGHDAGITPFGPVIDGELVAGQPWEAIGDGRDVDLICGFTHEEFQLFASAADTTAIDLAAVAASFDLGPGAVDAYRAAHPGHDDAALFSVMMSDALFRMPSTWVAEAHARAGGRTWLYDFAWRSPAFGACHALDVPFAFGDGDSPMAAWLLGSPPPADFAVLSEHIRRAWTAFAATGDPGWPRFDLQDRRTRIWDVPPSDVPYPLAASAEIWSGS